MSRVGKKPISLPDGVSAELKGRDLVVKGKLGTDSITLMDVVDVKVEGNIINVLSVGDYSEKSVRAAHGLHRALIANLVTGVASGFEKNLEIIGVGYRAQQQNKDVIFQLGYSHNVLFSPPEGITIEVLEPTKLRVKGINKQKVGQVAANIRKLRPPEPYKGKGIRYSGERVRKKAGKAGKK
ncbi:MAG TPA: 50S ribosomal protein L6 [Spirochaetota bacterium]|nr:50S ribosomal protein L6 [Spirochaetota bacterium]